MSNGHPDDLDYSYYDYRNQLHPTHDVDIFPLIPWASLVRITLVVLLRIGFVLVHVGSVPVNNVNLILLQNIIDFCWVTVIYILIGIVFAYTGDVEGLVGEGYWIGDENVDKDEVIIGWSAVVIASAICTCGIVGRTHTIGYLIIGLLLAGFLQPFLIHWIWTPGGWIRTNSLNEKEVHFHDYSGSTIVHLVGGLSGMIGCMVLGRRILRLSAIDDASVAVGSSGIVFAGQLLVFLGLQTLSIPNIKVDYFKDKKHQYIFINNLSAGCSCSVLVVAIHFVLPREEFNHWTVMRCVQATVSGLVIISAGTDIYTPLVAIGLGSAASIVYYLVSRQVFQSALEDYCNIVAIHLVCAVLGSLIAPLLNYNDGADVTLILLNFSWHLISLITVIALVTIVMLIAFAGLQLSGLLRNRSEYLNHLRASIAEERASRRRTFLERLFGIDRDPIYLQPGYDSDELPNIRPQRRRY
ncbi:Ammonium transporter 1 member 1 [Anthophora plagiata]